MNPIVPKFESLCRTITRRSQPEVFDDLIHWLLYIACVGRAHKAEAERIESTYSAEEFAAFRNFAENDLAEAATNFADPLGWIYESLSAGGHKSQLGQFFSPEPVAEMMAKIVGVQPTSGGVLRIGDPAGCGSGRMLLACAKEIGDQRWRHIFEGLDMDLLCVKIAALNCWWNTIPALLLHGDGLMLEVWGGYEICLTWYCGGWLPHIAQLPPDQLDNVNHLRREAVNHPDLFDRINAGRVERLEAQRTAGKKALQYEFNIEPEPTPAPTEIAPPQTEKRPTKRNAPPPNQTSLW